MMANPTGPFGAGATARFDGLGPLETTKPIVPPNALPPPPLYLTISGLVPWVIFAQCGLPQHHVNIEPPRPVCVAHAPFLKAWSAAGAKVLPIEPLKDVAGVFAGAVIPKLVKICRTGVAFLTTTTLPDVGFENT